MELPLQKVSFQHPDAAVKAVGNINGLPPDTKEVFKE